MSKDLSAPSIADGTFYLRNSLLDIRHSIVLLPMKPLYQTVCLVLFVVGAAVPGGGAAQRILYVDAGASGANDGSVWADAFTDLQDALSAATRGDEIWVAEGVYKPVVPADSANVTDPERGEPFQLKNGVSLYGGFAGNEASRDERDVLIYPTILSGDLLGNDTDNVDPDEPRRSDNSWHVVKAGDVDLGGVDSTTVLDGFTITGGNANGLFPDDEGGGMYNSGSSPTVRNCTFSGNAAADNGGGMSNDASSPTVTNCTFTGNTAADNGGGMSNSLSSPTVTNCTFSGNTAATDGGGMFNGSGSSSIGCGSKRS